jgi:acetyl-CoA carboxylase biotin carboxyl carrier protein
MRDGLGARGHHRVILTKGGDHMDLNYVKKLIKLVSESGVDELEIEEEGKTVRIVKRHSSSAAARPLAVTSPGPEISIAAPGAPSAVTGSPLSPAAAVPEKKYHEIKSPIVGTFYRAPAPDAAPFVQVGTEVEAGTVLCIVEAMKLMNEIEADAAGKIVKILVENGQPVEYDQTLFLVEPVS